MPSVKATMHEFKHGTLHSGSKKGPVVKNRKQAIAIALSEERKAGADREVGAMEDQVKRRNAKIRSRTADYRGEKNGKRV